MANGIAINIGLNGVDPKHYQGWDGKLGGCEFDANDMNAMAKARGFQTQLLLTAQATSAHVVAAIKNAAGKLKAGDLLFLTYSGHGGQVPDKNGDEPDHKDETWVLYDRQLVDDELYALWSKFPAGVRIFVLSDSCHSGSVTRAMLFDSVAANPATAAAVGVSRKPRYKAVPKDVEEKTYNANQALYDEIQRGNPAGESVEVAASVLLISGCQDNQLSSDGDRNGLFTEKLLAAWKEGGFKAYKGLYDKIVEKMPPMQTPNYFKVGTRSTKFERQSPLTI